MQKAMLLALACALLACSDGKPSSASKPDAGDENTNEAGSEPEDDAGASTEASGLERAPGSLPRPQAKKLPDDLKPPDFAK
jgi:hypothetical protein